MNQESDRILPMVLTFLAFVNYGLMYALDLLFARTMGTDGYDNYGVAVAVLSILLTLSTFGLEKFALKAIPTYVEAADWQHLRFSSRCCSCRSDFAQCSK